MHTQKDKDYLSNLRHSCAHLLAAAVMEQHPDAKRTIGPAIEDGFYFDFEFAKPIGEDDLQKIEKKMHEIAPSWKNFERHELSPEDAKKEYPGNPYKHELIEEFSQQGQTLTFYKSGSYWDLCRGGHVEHPDKELKHFKLLKLAGAYWRGDEKNTMLTRIYGTAFGSKEELNEYLTRIEEAKKRDHRKLGKELGLFIFSDLVGPGMPIYTPKGWLLRNAIIEYSRALNHKVGFQEVHTPNINKAELFRISGHHEKYKNDMLEVRSHYTDEEYYLKPMNCPQHTQIYAAELRSYKDLPVRYSDFANLYRDEKPGELSGLTRLRCFCQDDGHAFCREDQIGNEFKNILGVIREALTAYGLAYSIRLSLRDPRAQEQYLGDDAVWNRAEAILENLLKENNVAYDRAEGEAAFYGPKMDILAHDSIGRTWQISTIQLDLNMPGRFGLVYTDNEGKEQTPVMIHRALIGSPERFMAILIEHYAGAFPVWLAPVQVQVIPVGSRHNEYCAALSREFASRGLRVEVDDANETVGNKIRKATKAKIPYLLVIGDKEISSPHLHVRKRGSEEVTEIEKEKFIETARKDITEKKIW